jgi:hypothetical protein
MLGIELVQELPKRRLACFAGPRLADPLGERAGKPLSGVNLKTAKSLRLKAPPLRHRRPTDRRSAGVAPLLASQAK